MLLRIQSGRWWLTLLLGLSAAGCDRGGTGAVQRPLPRVTVAHPVARQLTDEDDYTGWLRPSQEVEVRSRVRGHIQKIHFRDGDLVKRGELLFELDPREFQTAIEQNLAQVKLREGTLKYREPELDRAQQLLPKNAISQSDYDKAVSEHEEAVAALAAAKQEVEQDKLNLEYSRITAPINGRIDRALLSEGNLVNAGGTEPVLTTIVAIEPVYVYFNVDERALQRYQKNRQREAGSKPAASLRELKIPFRFGLDTDEGFPHAGVLDFAQNKVSSSTGTIELRGEAKNPDGRLTPGSRVRVRVPVSDPYESVLVPDSAVLSDQDRKYLLVLGKDNVVLRRDFSPGRLLDDGMRVILPAPGEEKAAGNEDWMKGWQREWVVTLGLQRARIDYPVQPLDAKGQPIDTTAAAH